MNILKKKVAIFTFDGISSLHLSIPCAVFQDAFYDQESPFDVRVCSKSSQLITSSSGFSLKTETSLSWLKTADIVIIPSWIPDTIPDEEFTNVLRYAVNNNATIIGLCLGAYALAYVGLLDGLSATTHWGFTEDFAMKFPKVNVEADKLYIDNGQIITSAGVMAGLDCCLDVLKNELGIEVSNQVARNLVTTPHREGGQKQYISIKTSDYKAKDIISETMNWLNNNLADKHSLTSVSARCAMSPRTFSRKFSAINNTSFGRWLANERLKYSQQLLESTSHTLGDISELTGFGTEENLRNQFKNSIGISPNQWRKKFKC